MSFINSAADVLQPPVIASARDLLFGVRRSFGTLRNDNPGANTQHARKNKYNKSDSQQTDNVVKTTPQTVC